MVGARNVIVQLSWTAGYGKHIPVDADGRLTRDAVSCGV